MNLIEYKDKNYFTYVNLGDLFGVSDVTTYYWCSGKKLPSLRNFKKIEKVTNFEVTRQEMTEFYNYKKNS